jgi:hypothetical protein
MDTSSSWGESPMDTDNGRVTPTDGHNRDIELCGKIGSLYLEETPKSTKSRVTRVPVRVEGKVLFGSVSEAINTTSRLPNWTKEEVKCLIDFLLLHTDGKSWVAHKDTAFWDEAGIFIQQQATMPYRRSGKLHHCCVG